MSKFKLYYGGQLFKMAGLVVKEMPPEKDVLTYTYEDGIYTMSISNPSRTTLRLLEQGNLVISASIRDVANPSSWSGWNLYIFDEEIDDTAEYPTVRNTYHPRYAIPGRSDENSVYIYDLSNFTFDESILIQPRGIGNLIGLSNAAEHEPIESITTQYKFVLRNQASGRVYKSYSKTDGYHPITFYNTDEY